MGFPCWLPVSACGPTVPDEFPTKKLLWEKYKKASMGRPKGGENREKNHSVEIIRDQVWRSLCFQHFPHYRKPLFPWFIMSFHLFRYPWVSYGRSLLKAWDWMNLEDGFAWSLHKEGLGEIIPYCILVICNKETLVPFLKLIFFMLMMFMLWFAYE